MSFLSGRTSLTTVQTGDIAANAVTSAKLGTGAIIGTDIQAFNSAIMVDGDIGSSVQAYDADTLKADTDDTLSGGYQFTADADGTKSSGTYTPAYASGNVKTATNGGAHTLAPQSGNGVIIIQYTNDGSAGTITTSGFDKVTGDSFSTTNTNTFLCQLTVVGAESHLHVTDTS